MKGDEVTIIDDISRISPFRPLQRCEYAADSTIDTDLAPPYQGSWSLIGLVLDRDDETDGMPIFCGEDVTPLR